MLRSPMASSPFDSALMRIGMKANRTSSTAIRWSALCSRCPATAGGDSDRGMLKLVPFASSSEALNGLGFERSVAPTGEM